MIVRMNAFITAFAARNLAGAVGHHFVHVHVRRSAGASLENVYDKLRIQFPIDHLLRGLLDGFGNIFRQQIQRRIRDGSVLLNQAQRADKLPGKT